MSISFAAQGVWCTSLRLRASGVKQIGFGGQGKISLLSCNFVKYDVEFVG